MKLSVIIVNYNVKYYLEQCLYSLERAAQGVDYEVIVVDNASTDGSNDYIPERFPRVKWIARTCNEGFSHGNIIAYSQTSGEYVLMLNPDTIVTRKAIVDSIKFMEEHPNVGCCGVKMINRDGSFAMESRRGIVTPWVSICKATGLCRRFPDKKLFGHYYMSYLDKEQANPIEMASGAFMLLRRETLNKVGFLDEQFFMYWEDSDLSYRILKAGYQNYYLPHPILHYKGESSVKSILRYRYWLYSSLRMFFKKHSPMYYIISYIPLSFTAWFLKARIGKGKEKVRQEEMSPRFLVIGSKKATEEIQEIFTLHNIKGEHKYIVADETSTPDGHTKQGISTDGFTHVLYDYDNFSFDRIIDLIQKTHCKKLRLATYSTKSKRIITDGAVYGFDNE